MNLLSSNIFRAAAVAIALPLLGLSVTVSSPTLTYATGASETGSSYDTVTGPFTVTSTYAVGVASNGGVYVDFFPVVKYTGSAPLAAATTVDVDLLASITAPGALNWDGKYTEHIPLSVSPGGSATGELFVDGQGIGLISGGPGYSSASMSKVLDGVDGATVSFSYDYAFTFAAGTAPGAIDSSTAPEPATMIPAAFGLAGLALVAIRRRKQ
jgi:MYXO-CTERM domain-containing protein